MTTWEHDFIFSSRVARLATVDTDGHPHVVPIVYAYDRNLLYTPLDAKPKRVNVRQLQRVKNIHTHPNVAVVIDEYDEDWTRLAWVQIRGTARIIEGGTEYSKGIALLTAKYPQYQQLPLTDRPLIVVTPAHVTGWRSSP